MKYMKFILDVALLNIPTFMNEELVLCV